MPFMRSNADLPSTEEIILNRLRALINKAHHSDGYKSIPGAQFDFPLTKEIIELNTQRKTLLLDFLEKLAKQENPKFNLAHGVILPGMSERHFHLQCAYHHLNAMDTMKHMGFFRRLYTRGNHTVVSSLLKKIQNNKWYVDRSKDLIYWHDSTRCINPVSYYIFNDKVYFFKRGILRSILYGDIHDYRTWEYRPDF